MASNDLHDLMVARTGHIMLITYLGGKTLTLTGVVLTVRPVFHPTSNTTRFIMGDAGSTLLNLPDGAGWDVIGTTRGVPTVNASINRGGGDVDGLGRPDYDYVSMEQMVVLPRVLEATPTASRAFAVDGMTAVEINTSLYLVMNDMRITAMEGEDEDSRISPALRLTLYGEHELWCHDTPLSGAFFYHDAVGADTAWATPPDRSVGWVVEGSGYTIDKTVAAWSAAGAPGPINTILHDAAGANVSIAGDMTEGVSLQFPETKYESGKGPQGRGDRRVNFAYTCNDWSAVYATGT